MNELEDTEGSRPPTPADPGRSQTMEPWTDSRGMKVLSDLTHELRTPLGSILMLTELLGSNRSGNLDDKDLGYVRKIRQAVSDLRDLIEEVGLINRIDSGRVTPTPGEVSLRELIAAVEKGCREAAEEKGLRWAVAFEAALPSTVRTDRALCERTLSLLMASAVRAAEEGEVAIDVGRPRLDSLPAGVADAIAITVRDTAPAMPEDQLAAVFDPFEHPGPHNRRRFGGQSLALPLARRLSRLLGGELVATVVEGGGNAFVFYLPVG